MRMTWIYRLVLAVCLGGLVAGCSRPQDPFPTEFEIDRNRQAEILADFIHARFDAQELAAEGFANYVRQVERGERVDPGTFDRGKAIFPEFETDQIIEYFLESPEGAYLSDADHEFIERTLVLRDKRLKTAFEFLGEENLGTSYKVAQDLDLITWYTAGGAMRAFLRQIPTELLEDFAEEIREEMRAEGREALWLSLALGDAEALRAYDESRQDPSLAVLTVLPLRKALVNADLGPYDRKLVFLALKPLSLVLSQAFDSALYGKVLARVERVGFNAYMGPQERDLLHQRAMDAVKAIEARQ